MTTLSLLVTFSLLEHNAQYSQFRGKDVCFGSCSRSFTSWLVGLNIEEHSGKDCEETYSHPFGQEAKRDKNRQDRRHILVTCDSILLSRLSIK